MLCSARDLWRFGRFWPLFCFLMMCFWRRKCGAQGTVSVIKCFGNSSPASQYRVILAVCGWAFHSSEMRWSLIASFLLITPQCTWDSLENTWKGLLPGLYLHSCFQWHYSFSRPVSATKRVCSGHFIFCRILKAAVKLHSESMKPR